MALLFVFDLFSPKAAADIGIHSAGKVDKSTVRIRSDQKWPERVVFDTAQPTPASSAVQTAQAQTIQTPPIQAQAALAGPEPAPEITPKARVRETFAQFVPLEPTKPEAAAAKKRKVAKTGAGQPLRLAQQRYFGTSTW